MKKRIAEFIFHRLMGWKFVGSFPSDLKKCVIIGAPHTSWHDFYLGVFFRDIQGITLNFVGKKSLFDSPFGWFFRSMGGMPVDRSKNANLVDAIIDIFNEKEEFRLAISPEGTRKKVEKWKTGFYYIAKGANVPIIMITFDFKQKQIAISEPYFPTEDKEKDFEYFHKFYDGVLGKADV